MPGDDRLSFVALDFETANHLPNSPCQVAIAVVEQGRLAAERSWLVRPPELYFSERCIAVHGIQPGDVADQPEFDAIWQELWPWLQGRVLLAHHAGFDMGVLAATLRTYHIDYPALEFQCTRLIARRSWPSRNGYGLRPTADMLGIVFRHHDAGEDARACAEIAIAAARVTRTSSLEALEAHLFLERGYLSPEKKNLPRTRRLSKSARSALQLPLKQIEAACEGLQPLAGKRLLLSGSLFGLGPVESTRFLEQLGAAIDPTLTSETELWVIGSDAGESEVVIGSRIEHELNAHQAESLPRLAEADRKPVTRVISQRQLLAMIPGGLQAVRRWVDGYHR
jgi:DNA polymerase-3 subunit epsilon